MGDFCDELFWEDTDREVKLEERLCIIYIQVDEVPYGYRKLQ